MASLKENVDEIRLHEALLQLTNGLYVVKTRDTFTPVGKYAIGSSAVVFFGTNANPNTGGTTFSPDFQNNLNSIYVSTIDNKIWRYNGTTYVTATLGSTYTANNGITLTGTNFQLGGALTTPTTITSSATNTMTFASTANAKVAIFTGDIDVQGQIDPNSIVFSDGITATYNAATQNGYMLGIQTGATQRPIYVKPLSDTNRVFEVRTTNDTVSFSVDTLNNRVGLGTSAPDATGDVKGDFAVRNQVNFTGVGTQNNISSTNISTLRLTGVTTTNITGFANGVDGKFLFIRNVSSANKFIFNLNAGSLAANQIVTGTGKDYTILPGAVAILQYDATSSVWRLCSSYFGLGKFRVVAALVAGDNTITHNLGLSDSSVIVDVRDNATGAIISARVTAEASNSITLNVAAAITNVRITIIG